MLTYRLDLATPNIGIADHDQLKLTVKVDDSAVAANVSMSMVLIELFT